MKVRVNFANTTSWSNQELSMYLNALLGDPKNPNDKVKLTQEMVDDIESKYEIELKPTTTSLKILYNDMKSVTRKNQKSDYISSKSEDVKWVLNKLGVVPNKRLSPFKGNQQDHLSYAFDLNLGPKYRYNDLVKQIMKKDIVGKLSICGLMRQNGHNRYHNYSYYFEEDGYDYPRYIRVARAYVELGKVNPKLSVLGSKNMGAHGQDGLLRGARYLAELGFSDSDIIKHKDILDSSRWNYISLEQCKKMYLHIGSPAKLDTKILLTPEGSEELGVNTISVIQLLLAADKIKIVKLMIEGNLTRDESDSRVLVVVTAKLSEAPSRWLDSSDTTSVRINFYKYLDPKDYENTANRFDYYVHGLIGQSGKISQVKIVCKDDKEARSKVRNLERELKKLSKGKDPYGPYQGVSNLIADKLNIKYKEEETEVFTSTYKPSYSKDYSFISRKHRSSSDLDWREYMHAME